MKLKSLKSKVIAGAAGIVIVSSGGVALANTEAGEALQNWYNGMFDNTATSVDSQVTEYTEGLIPDLTAEYNGLKDDATVDINHSRDENIMNTSNEINDEKDRYIEDIGATKERIMSSMGQQFYNDVFLPGYFQIQSLAAEGQAYATEDLTNFTGTKGEEALGKVTADLTAAKDAAVSELEEAIRQAQEELEAELAANEEIAVRNLQNQVNFAINDVRLVVEELLAELVAEQQQIIADAAQALEEEAKLALDDVVSGMDGE